MQGTTPCNGLELGGVHASRNGTPASQPPSGLDECFLIRPGFEANPRRTELGVYSTSVSNCLGDTMLRQTKGEMG